MADGVKKKTPKVRAFLSAIAQLPNVSWAARAAGIRRELHYRRLKVDPVYKAAFESAWRMGCEELEGRAMARAIEGVDEPVFYQGDECGHVTRYYHTEFLLRGAMPEKYRERQEITGKDGGPIQSSITVRFVDANGSGLPEKTTVPVSAEPV